MYVDRGYILIEIIMVIAIIGIIAGIALPSVVSIIEESKIKFAMIILCDGETDIWVRGYRAFRRGVFTIS